MSASPLVVVVDYKKGNIQSVVRSFETLQASVRVSEQPDDIARADALVLPGVGSFRDAAEALASSGQSAALREALGAGVPFLGICLGMHLLCEAGTEDAIDKLTPGLGYITGVVDALSPSPRIEGVIQHKVPHVGWDTVHYTREDCPLFEGIPSDEYFYFTHSFAVPSTVLTPTQESACAAITSHTEDFPSVIWDGQVAFGVQFHPEKSSDAGRALIENFLKVVRA